MRTQKRNRMLAALMLVVVAPAAMSAQRNDVEDRLRDMLRQTTIELRDAQSQNVELRAKVDELTARQAAAKQSSSRTNVDATALRRAKGEVEQLRAALFDAQSAIEARDQEVAQWKQAYAQAEQVSNSRDSEAKRLDEMQRTLTQRVDSCERDNAQLIEVAEDLLERYRSKGVWTAMRDAEPLTGIKRVQLETLAQQYRAKILDLRATPVTAAPPHSPPATQP